MYEFVAHGDLAGWYPTGVQLLGEVSPTWNDATAPELGAVYAEGVNLVVVPPSLARHIGPSKGGLGFTVITTDIDGGGLAGAFTLPPLSPGSVFTAGIASGTGGRDRGTHFTVDVAPVAGTTPPQTVADVSLTAGTRSELRCDLSAFDGQAVVVTLTTTSIPFRTVGRRPTFHPGRGRQTGTWTRPRVGTVAQVDSCGVNILVTELSVREVDPVGTEFPAVAIMGYVVDGSTVSDALTGSPAAPARVGHSIAVGPMVIARWSPTMVPLNVPALKGDDLVAFAPWTFGYRLTVPLAVQAMGGTGDPHASFAGIVALALEEDSSANFARATTRDQAFVQFRLQAEAKLQAMLPVGGAKTGLTLADSTTLRQEFDQVAATIPAAVGWFLWGTADPDEIVGLAHMSWSYDELVASGVGVTADVQDIEGSAYTIWARSNRVY